MHCLRPVPARWLGPGVRLRGGIGVRTDRKFGFRRFGSFGRSTAAVARSAFARFGFGFAADRPSLPAVAHRAPLLIRYAT